MDDLTEQQKLFIEKHCGELIKEKKEFTEVTIDYEDVEEDGSADDESDEGSGGVDVNISKW